MRVVWRLGKYARGATLAYHVHCKWFWFLENGLIDIAECKTLFDVMTIRARGHKADATIIDPDRLEAGDVASSASMASSARR